MYQYSIDVLDKAIKACGTEELRGEALLREINSAGYIVIPAINYNAENQVQNTQIREGIRTAIIIVEGILRSDKHVLPLKILGLMALNNTLYELLHDIDTVSKLGANDTTQAEGD